MEEREVYIGSLGDKLPCQSTSISNHEFASRTEQPTEEDMYNDHDDHNDQDVALDDHSICSASQERMDCMELNSEKKKSVVTYRDFTDVANSVVNLALTLPSEDFRRECLGLFVRMRDALSMSAATGLQPPVRMLGFMASAEDYLSAFGPNTESRREGVFQPLANPAHFEMQRHNSGKAQALDVV